VIPSQLSGRSHTPVAARQTLSAGSIEQLAEQQSPSF
jgi:hypothetical protein